MKTIKDFLVCETKKHTVDDFNKLKELHDDRLIIYINDDVCELYNEDAIKASNILNVKPTKTSDNGFTEILSFKLEELTDNLMKLIKAGEKVMTMKK